jgi:predicted alpha/beta hydrolase family esterase
MAELRHVLVPGGGGSGPEHWHHRWAKALRRVEWVVQADQAGGTRADWLTTLDAQINTSDGPVVLVAHSLACVAVAHWAENYDGPVAAALLVAPADVEDDWAEPDSLYKRFAPIPTQPLPFRSVVVASTNDPLLSVERAHELAGAWNANVELVGDQLHVGSDALLDEWPVGRAILDDLVTGLSVA